MKFFFKTIAFIIFISFGTYAQKEFVAGKITNLKGEVSNVFIADEQWEFAPINIKTKATKNDKTITFSAEEILGFELIAEAQKFVSKKVMFSTLKKEIDLGSSPIDKTIEKQCFIRTLMENDILKLYSLTPQEDGRERFLIEKEGVLAELEKFEYLVTDKENHQFLIKNTNYLTQLKELLSDCETFKFNNPLYDDSAILKTLNQYCSAKTNTPVVYNSAKAPYQFFFVPSSNLSASSYYFGIGARIYAKKGAKNKFTGIDLNFYSIKNNSGILPSFDLYFGANTRQKSKFKGYFQAGLAAEAGFRNVWVSPTIGVCYNQFIYLEVKRLNSILPSNDNGIYGNPVAKTPNFNVLTLRIGPVFRK